MKILLRAMLALLLLTATARAVPVTVRVVDAAGKPIANASAQVVDYADRPADYRQRPVATAAKATTNGTIALDLRGTPHGARSADIGNFVPAEVSVGAARVSAPGYGVRNLELLPGDNVIALGAPAHLSGVVRDDAGAPIARATVELLGVEPDETYNYRDRSLARKFDFPSATTRSDGSWELPNLPTGYAYIVAHAPDKAAHNEEFWVYRGENQAKPFALSPAGSVIGRILDRDGKPVAGVSVGATNTDDPRSDAAGRFRVENVPLGESSLDFASSSADWLGMDEEVNANVPAPGAVVDVGDIKMGAGLLLSGTTRDRDGAALPNLELRADEKTFRTDATGHFEARVSKPFYVLEIVGDYRKIRDTPRAPNNATQFDLGEIKVERAFNWPLDVRDENGNAVLQATLKFTSTDDAHLQRTPMFGEGGVEVGVSSSPLQRESSIDGAGVWVPSLPAADYKIEGLGLWGVVEPQTATLKLPAIGEKPAPLQIVVRYFAPARASGRVVDEAGAPLENARVQISAPDGYRSHNVFSDERGEWSVLLPDAAEPTFDKAEFAAFNFVSGGQMTREGDPQTNAWRAADIVMARTDVALAGRVVDDQGAPVIGARVGWNDNEKLFRSVATDSAGQFSIAGLSNVATAVYAASSDGTRFTSAVATPGAPVELRLPPAKAPLSAGEIERMWDQLPIKYLSDLRDHFDELGVRRVYQVARRLDDKADPTKVGDGLSGYLELRLNRARTPAERADVVREGIELLRRFDLGTVNRAMGRIALTAARSDDDELRAWAARWLDAQTPLVKPLDSPAKIQWYDEARSESVMQVSAALGRADAVKYRDIWIKQIDRENNPSIKQFLPDWGEALWDSNPQWFDEIVGTWPASQQMSALTGALRNETNSARAKALLARLEHLAEAAAPDKADATETMGQLSQSSQALWQGSVNFARALALVDAPAVLAVLEQRRLIIPFSETDEIAAIIARAAIADGRGDIARRALKLGLLNNGDTATFALIARDFDADLHAQLTQATRKKAQSGYFNIDPPGWRSVTSYTVPFRDLDAGTKRMVIEDRWVKLQGTPDSDYPNKEYLQHRIFNVQESLAQTMASYDVARALQWLSEIKDDRNQWNNRLESTRISIVVKALTSSAQRESLGAG